MRLRLADGFSVFSVMVLVAVVAIAFGCIIKPFRDQNRAAAELTARGVRPANGGELALAVDQAGGLRPGGRGLSAGRDQRHHGRGCAGAWNRFRTSGICRSTGGPAPTISCCCTG